MRMSALYIYLLVILPIRREYIEIPTTFALESEQLEGSSVGGTLNEGLRTYVGCSAIVSLREKVILTGLPVSRICALRMGYSGTKRFAGRDPKERPHYHP